MQTVSVQLLLLLYIVFGWTAMLQDRNGGSLSSQLSNNQFSGAMVVAAICQVGVIVLDRVAYLYRSQLIKALLQWTLTVFIHGMMVFYVPLTTQVPFSENTVGFVFYLLYVVYLLLGSMQLYLGFSSAPPTDSLKSQGVNPPFPLFFRIYSAVPFLMEMRHLLDWCCAHTSLDVFMHLQLSAIHTELFLVKAEMAYRKRDEEVLSGRQPQPGIWKLVFGGLLFALLLFVLLFPALLFSTLNPTLQDNPVLTAHVSVGVVSDGFTFPLLAVPQPDLLTNITHIPGPFWDDIRVESAHGSTPTPLLDSFRDGTQVVSMSASPPVAWTPTPPQLAALEAALARKANTTGGPTDLPLLEVQLTATFTRAGPPDSETVSATYRQLLSHTQARELDAALRALLGAGGDVDSPCGTAVDAHGDVTLGDAATCADADSVLGATVVPAFYCDILRLRTWAVAVLLRSAALHVGLLLLLLSSLLLLLLLCVCVTVCVSLCVQPRRTP